MALPPSLQALSIGPSHAPHTLEVYVDYLCPFSSKQLIGIQHQLVPLVFGQDAPWKDQLRIVVRPYPQPWHGTSTLLNEAAIASAKISRKEPDVVRNPKTSELHSKDGS